MGLLLERGVGDEKERECRLYLENCVCGGSSTYRNTARVLHSYLLCVMWIY